MEPPCCVEVGRRFTGRDTRSIQSWLHDLWMAYLKEVGGKSDCWVTDSGRIRFVESVVGQLTSQGLQDLGKAADYWLIGGNRSVEDVTS